MSLNAFHPPHLTWLQVVSQRCRSMYRSVDMSESSMDLDPLDQSELGRLAISAATVRESYQAKQDA